LSASDDLEQALACIESEAAVWWRLAASDEQDGWLARLVEITTGAAPPGWEDCDWVYPNCVFRSRVDSGPAVAGWLRKGVIDVGDQQVTLPELTRPVSWERRQSRSPAVYEALDWPVTVMALSTLTTGPTEPRGHLVSAGDAPSFLNFFTACAYLFRLSSTPSGGSLNQGVMVRQQDTHGRISAVRVTASAVEVDVEGRDLDGMTIELAGDRPGPRLRVRHGRPTADSVSFPPEDGLLPGSWVVLRRRSEWIDRRFLSVPWTPGPEAGVELVVEPATRLEALVSGRERQYVEFKRELGSSDESKAKVMKTVCAFANGEGGSLLIGVDDDRVIVGIDPRKADSERDRVTQLIGSWLEPRPETGFTFLPVGESARVVLELLVSPGLTLYGSGRPGETRIVYVRHHGVTERATPAEITAIVQIRMPG